MIEIITPEVEETSSDYEYIKDYYDAKEDFDLDDRNESLDSALGDDAILMPFISLE